MTTVDSLDSYDPTSVRKRVTGVDVEGHVAVAAILAAVAVACDCVTAFDPLSMDADAPESLRATSLVLIAIVAAPKLRLINLVDQRVLTGSMLAAAALLGSRVASEQLRTADSTFTSLMLLALVQIVYSGGIEADSIRPDGVGNTPFRRQSTSALVGSLLFYSGVRGVRSAFLLAASAVTLQTEYDVGGVLVVGTGYSHASMTTSVALGWGHGVVAAVGALIGLSGPVFQNGSSAVAFEVAFAAVATAVCALWAFLYGYQGLEAMPILYGSSACGGGEDTCMASSRARRFAVVNESTASLWVSVLAMLAFSFAVERRFRRLHAFEGEKIWQRHAFSLGLAVCFFALLAVALVAPWSGTGWQTDVVAAVAVVSIFLGFFSDPVLAFVIYTSAMTFKQTVLIREHGALSVFEHLTHQSLLSILYLAWTYVALLASRWLLERNFDVAANSSLNLALGAVSTSLTSLTFALYLASALLVASLNGALPKEGAKFVNESTRRFVVTFALDHFLPLFAVVPLHFATPEASLLSRRAKAAAWVSVVALVVIFYIAYLVVMEATAPTAAMVQIGPVAPAAVVAAVAWLATAFA